MSEMNAKICLLLLALTSTIYGQNIPQFEPLFSSNTIQVTVDERPQEGDEILSTRARGLQGETVIYGLDLPSSEQGVLVIDPLTGLLSVGPNGPNKLVISDNTPVTISAAVYAFYNSSGSAFINRAYLFVMVEVRDINDAPKFGSAAIEIPVSETIGAGTVVTRIIAIDHDLSNDGVVLYSLEQIAPVSTSGTFFIINQLTGDLIVARSLELNTSYQLRVTATDEGIPPLSSDIIVDVIVYPTPPTFLQSVYNASIREFSIQTPVTLVTVEAIDPGTPNTVIVYSVGAVIPANNDIAFSIGRLTGTLSVSGTADREIHSRYLVQIRAHEDGHDSTSFGAALAFVVVTISDVNEPPEFLNSHYTVVIPEGASIGTTLISDLVAIDNDEGTNSILVYTITMVTGLQSLDGERVIITDPLFLINSNTAVITVNTDLERESTHYYEIIVTVSDAGVTPLTATTLVAVTVADVNDNSPVFDNTTLAFSFPENEPSGSIVGVFTVSDRDQGLASQLSLSLQGDFAERFYVNVISVIYSTLIEAQPPVITRARIYSAETLDREDTDTYQFSIVAQDNSEVPLTASIPLTISISDRNDNEPLFANSNFNFVVSEGTNDSFVTEFAVFDADIGSSGEVDFFLDSAVDGLFTLITSEPFVTQLHTSHQLDRELQDSYSFRVFAMDRGSPPLIGQTDILIEISDVNDNSPVFQTEVYQVTVVENEQPGFYLTTVVATDSDIGSNGEILYVPSNQPFVIVDPISGNLTLVSSLDFELGSPIDIEILATDNGDPPLTRTTVLRITITDVNDNSPVFEQASYNVSVAEQVAAGSTFARITATDADSGEFGEVFYSIVYESMENIFQIDSVTGFLTVARVLDRETDENTYNLTVSARDNGDPPLSSEVAVSIELADINDQTPVFVNEPYITEVNEGSNQSAGVFVYTVSASDTDIGINQQILYSLTGDFVEFFSIDRSTGVITVSPIGVDFEAVTDNPVLVFTVLAMDQGVPPRIVTTTISITVLDGNDNSPQFIGAPYLVSIPESSITERQLIIDINATDLDRGISGEIQFQLAGEHAALFEIDENSGEIFLPAGIILDRDTNIVPHNEQGDAVYTLGIAVNDRGSPQQFAFATVSIFVTDVNDNSPVFQTDTLSRFISESLPVETNVLNLVATDNDFGTNAQIVYSIVLEESDAGIFTEGFMFFIEPTTGVLSLASTLDRETVPEIRLVIEATDQGPGNNQDNVTVFINVTDVNDNRPVFTVPAGGYVATVYENSPLGTEVITVIATDVDEGLHQSISYSILSNFTELTNVPFEIRDPTVGVITVASLIDRESVSEYQVLVVVMDSARDAGNIQQSLATVQVSILDVNDNVPMFEMNSYSGSVAENSPPGTTVELELPLSVSDADTSGFYFELSGSGTEFFTINQTTGVITTVGIPFDFETQQEFSQLVLRVNDGNFSSVVPLRVVVTDVNDNSPVFDPNFVTLAVSENTTIGSELFVAIATDQDQGINSQLFYSLEDDSTSEVFTINSLSGIITLISQLDFESQQSYVLTVVAQDMGEAPLNDSLVIDVVIMDENDNHPLILNPNPIFSVFENSKLGTIIGRIDAIDFDLGLNREFQFLILSDEINHFQINASTGVITVSGAVDRELQDSYQFLVQVRDTSTFPLSNQTVVTVVVEDVNDNSPLFETTLISVSVTEDISPLSEVVVVRATDIDVGINSEIMYTIEAQDPVDHFIINELTGSLTVNSSLDFESVSSYTLTVIAKDRGIPNLTTNQTVVINLIDENDNTPIFVSSTVTATIAENAVNGSIATRVEATDADSGTNGQLVYSIIAVVEITPGTDSPFEIDGSSGVVTVFNSTLLDYELYPAFHIQIQATDQAVSARSSQVVLSVSLTDVNDNAPEFSLATPDSVTVVEGASVGSIVTVARATDRDQGINAEITYSILSGDPSGQFGIAADGSVIVNGPIDFENEKSYDLVLEALDGGSPPLSGMFDLAVSVIDINDNSPTFPSNFPETISISESTVAGTEVIKLEVIDPDEGDNGLISWTLVNQDANAPFTLTNDTGALSVVSTLDRETVPQYSLVIEATDNGVPTRSVEATITVFVLDINDNLPLFESPPVFTIRENQTPGTVFGVVDTTDEDLEKQAFYYIIGGSDILQVEPLSGEVFLRTNVDFEAGQTILTALLAAVGTNTDPTDTCTVDTCSLVTLTVNIEDWNDNSPQLSEFNFGANESSPENTIIGQVLATDVDTGAFGTVRYEFLTPQTKFSIDGENGTIRLVEVFNITADDEYNVIPINVFDNPGDRQQSFNTQSTVRIYFVNEFELVIVSVIETLPGVQAILDQLKRSLEDVTNDLSVYIFDIQEYVTSTADGQQQKRQTLQLTRTNITMFAVNHTSQGALTSTEFLSVLGSAVEGIVQQFAQFSTIEPYPEPPTPPPEGLSMETILLILYIVVGSLGGLVIFFFLALCITCCVIQSKNKKRGTKYTPKAKPKSGKRSDPNVYHVSGDTTDYQNPLWINPYGNWSDDPELGAVTYREKSPDQVINRGSEEITDSVLYESQEFVMANFTENTSSSEDEEALVEIKPDAQSLSQQSAGDSTFERRQNDKAPLIKKSQGRAWDNNDLRSSAELELTAKQETESEEDDEEYTGDEEEDEEESSGEEEDEEETTGESEEEEYDHSNDPNFPENGFPESTDTKEFPLMF